MSESERPSGLHGDREEVDLAFSAEHPPDEVEVADRDAAAGEHQVGTGGGLGEGSGQQIRVVLGGGKTSGVAPALAT